jgi:hypothetical protein
VRRRDRRRGYDGACLRWGGEAKERCSEPAGDDGGKSELLHFDPTSFFLFVVV